MPISEDEYEPSSFYEPSSTMSKAELRKTHKPIMEKKRRARINHCLNEIKTLILEAMKKDPARHSKLEKADILEMAVQHLQTVQKQQLAMAMASDPATLRKFKAGFNECAQEVKTFMSKFEAADAALHHRVSAHLSKAINGIEQIAQLNYPGLTIPFLGSDIFTARLKELNRSQGGDQNNNPNIAGLQLIPSRLPTGELALLLPNSSYLAKQSTNRPSAFVTVIPSALLAHQSHAIASATITSPHQSEAKTTAQEPLSVITNQSERFKVAHHVPESAQLEENVGRGLKRPREEEGLLAVVPPALLKPVKVVVLESNLREERNAGASTSRRNEESSGDMWRPW